MSKISYIIQQQKYELVRNRIAEILIDEIGNQFILSGDYELEDVDVTIEDYNAVDKSEPTLINVSLINGNYGQKSYEGSISGHYQYAVDCYTKSKTTSANTGYTLSAFKLHKITGICRAILEDPQYKTLGYTPGFIARVWASGIEIGLPKFEQGIKDAQNQMMSRIIFNVILTENVTLLSPTLAEGYDTKVKVENTTKGYQYITENYY